MDKVVSDYSGLNFEELLDLPLSRYCQLRRDGFIYKLNQTKSGQEYLEKCWILEQTQPDRKKLRKQFTRKEDINGRKDKGDNH